MSERPAGRYRVAAGSLHPGLVEIDAEQARHMRVRRLVAGARVVLFDGEGHEATAVLVSLSGEGGRARVRRVEAAPTESPLAVTLVQALPVKLPRMDDIVRQATELGVARVVPLIAARSQLPGGGRATLRRRVERWQRIAESAAKQCGRARVPQIEPPATAAELDRLELPLPRLLLDPRAAEALGATAVAGAAALTLLSGPEGGWEPAETERLRALEVQALRFGPRVLRADTAAPAALAVLQYLAGDLGEPGAT